MKFAAPSFLTGASTLLLSIELIQFRPKTTTSINGIEVDFFTMSVKNDKLLNLPKFISKKRVITDMFHEVLYLRARPILWNTSTNCGLQEQLPSKTVAK